MAQNLCTSFLIIIAGIALHLQGILAQEDDYKTIVLHGNYSTNITVAVNDSKQYIIHFRNSASMYPYTVYTSSNQSTVDYPVFILVTQQREATSWEIPLLVGSRAGTLSFWNISRTLCHNNLNAIAHMPKQQLYSHSDTNKIQHHGFYKHLTVSVSTVSKALTNVTIRVEEEKNFYIKENQTYELSISPSQPKYFYYKYQIDDSETRRSVILDVDSNDENCLTVSIQNATCPVFDLNEDITYEGKYETVNTKGGVIIDKNEFPNGFFVVFVAKGDNYDCDGQNSLIPMYKEQSNIKPLNRSSIVKFYIRADITKIDYLKYTFLTLGILLGFCLLFGCVSYVSLHLHIKRRERLNNIQGNNQLLYDDSIQQGDTAQLVVNECVADTSSSFQDIPIVDNDLVTIPEDAILVQNDISRNTNDQIFEIENSIGICSVEGCNSDYRSCISHGANQELESSGTLKLKRLKLTRPTLHDIIIKKPRVIYKESTHYCLNAVTIGIFYGIPVVQLVVQHQRLLDITGNMDICYYNFLCAHPYSIFNDYNHVLSNTGYICFGLLFLIITAVKEYKMPYIENCGIPKHYGIFYAMGVALTVEGILSGCYHVCPNQSNFQFDTSFMYVMAVLCIIKVYENRHPGINANAYFTFLLLAIAVLIAMVGILNGHLWIWIILLISYTGFSIFVAIKIYFINESKSGLALFLENRRNEGILKALVPLRKEWCIYLIVGILINFVLMTFGYFFYVYNIGFGTFLLFLLMGNAVIYTIFYVLMKFAVSRHQKKTGKEPTERPTLESLCYFLLAIITWGISFSYFVNNSSEWMESPAESRQRNTQCIVMDFYDNHDIWHLTSASALFFSFMALLTLDDNLVYTPRDEIVVF